MNITKTEFRFGKQFPGALLWGISKNEAGGENISDTPDYQKRNKHQRSKQDNWRSLVNDCKWKRQYGTDGVDAFLPQEQNRAYGSELKLRAVRDYLSGAGGLLDICQRYKVQDAHELRDWIQVYNAHGDIRILKRERYCGNASSANRNLFLWLRITSAITMPVVCGVIWESWRRLKNMNFIFLHEKRTAA